MVIHPPVSEMEHTGRWADGLPYLPSAPSPPAF